MVKLKFVSASIL